MLSGLLFAASLALSQSDRAKIDEAVRDSMQAQHVSGLTLGIARDGAVALLRAYGNASPGTVYRIGSLTKQFTAAVVLQESERGALGLSTAYDGFTVRELLAQTSGLSDDRATPSFDPGTGWQYSNRNYALLGALLESTTGQRFSLLLAQNIVTPLHLQFTTADDGADAAAIGMSSTVPDLLSWLHALYSGSVISAHEFAEMTTSQTLSSGERTHYGYGWYVRDWYGWKTVEHPGYVPGYSADDALVVDDGLEVVVLAKGTGAFLLPITKTIVSLVEPPRDESLVADFAHPAENENPAVTRDVREIVRELQAGTLDRTRLAPPVNARLGNDWVERERRLLAPLGDVTLVEFIGRALKNGAALEKYRVSFGYKQFWMTIGYDGNGKIDTLALDPDEE